MNRLTILQGSSITASRQQPTLWTFCDELSIFHHNEGSFTELQQMTYLCRVGFNVVHMSARRNHHLAITFM